MLTTSDLNKMDKPMLISLAQELLSEIETSATNLDEAKAERDTLEKALEEATQRIALYEEQLASLNLALYGPKTEKRTPVTQIPPDNTFNDAEVFADPSAPETTAEEVVKKRNRVPKEKGKRKKDFENIPVIEIKHVIDEDPDKCTCPYCSGILRPMGTETRDELVFVPAHYEVHRHITQAYECTNCKREDERSTIIKAPSPKPVIPYSGLASASLIANIVFDKFFMGLPLYRQEKEFKLSGINISRQNMSNWMILSALRYFKPLFDIMHHDLIQSKYIHCDETSVHVLKEPDRPREKKKNSKSYFWLFRTGRSEPHPIVLFKYSYSRSHEVPEEYLKGYHNYAHIDAYEAYHTIKDIIWVGCMAHVRRKFMDTFKLIPLKDRDQTPLTLCEVGLEYIDELFKIEEKIKELPYEEVYQKRQEESLPIVNEFFLWVKANIDSVVPGSKIGIALTYAQNQEEYLRRFLLDGCLEMSNNRAERDIKPVAIGRRNWLFADTDNGAEASSILYSMVLTAIENNLDPQKYIEVVLNELAQIPTLDYSPESLSKYLPYSEYMQSKCKPRLKVSSNPNK